MKLIRTDKEFKKENLPLDFLRRATSIGCQHTMPLTFEEADFEIEENWKGVNEKGGGVHPWSERFAKLGYTKTRSTVRINNNTSFIIG